MNPPLLYARCWEDEAILRRGLRLRPGDDVLSIASAGDNSLALLLDDPRSVTCIDRNTTQLALVHLKVAAIRHLEPGEARRFFGLEPAAPGERLHTWRRLCLLVPPFAQVLFEAEKPTLERGLLDAGKFERYLSLFRQRVLPLVQWPSTVRKMAALTDLEAQRRLYRDSWDTLRWRVLFRVFFGRRVMERAGRERAFFAEVREERVGDVFRKRAEKALCDLPVATNPYLVWVLTKQNLVPPYLDDASFFTIRERLDRLQIVEADLDAHLAAAAPGTYSAFNLSDCLEYLGEDAAKGLLRHAARAARPGARFVYWNLLVPRDGRGILESEAELAAALHQEDRAFFYGRLVVERLAA